MNIFKIAAVLVAGLLFSAPAFATSVVADSAAGTGASASLSGTSNDTAGDVILNTGTGTTTFGSVATVTYGTAKGSIPSHIQLQREDQVSQSSNFSGIVIVNSTVNGFDIGNNGNLPVSVSGIKWGYLVTP